MSTSPQGWYPQDAYYAPGWQAPADQSPPPRRPARWLVWVIVGVLALVAVGTLAAVVLRQVAVRPVGEVSAPLTVHARQVAVGHCIEDLPDDGAVARVRLVPCDQPHEAEVLAVHELPEGDWPGALDVRRRLVDACEMDRAQAEAGMRAVVWAPSEAGWASGDRTGVCLAWTPSS